MIEMERTECQKILNILSILCCWGKDNAPKAIAPICTQHKCRGCLQCLISSLACPIMYLHAHKCCCNHCRDDSLINYHTPINYANQYTPPTPPLARSVELSQAFQQNPMLSALPPSTIVSVQPVRQRAPIPRGSPRNNWLLSVYETAPNLYDRAYAAEQRGDYESARYDYEQAGALGNTLSLIRLGYMYKDANGVPQSNAKTLEYWTKAALLGDFTAMQCLSILYTKGTRVTADLALANLCQRAASGDPHAFTELKTRLQPAIASQVQLLQHKDLQYNPNQRNNILGTGGYAVVYRGQLDHTDVAIKQFHSAAANAAVQAEFEREVMLHGSLQHPHIVILFGAVFEPPRCLVMELMQGSVRDWLDDSRNIIPWSERLRIAREIALGLGHLHDKGIIHRDLKAANVLLNENQTAKVSDFGLAQVKKTLMSQAYAPSTKGTVAWMAPELFNSEKHTAASDIYAYGMTLWEMCSRQIPFAAENNYQVIINQVKSGKRPVIPGDTSEVLRQIIGSPTQGCWTTDPTERPMLATILTQLQAQQAKPLSGDTVVKASVLTMIAESEFESETDSMDPDGFAGNLMSGQHQL